MRTWSLVICVVATLASCGGDPPPRPDKPAAPAQNDPAFSIRGLRHWYLIGDGVTPGDDQLAIIVQAPSGTRYVDAYLGDLAPRRMIDQADGFGLAVDLAEVPAGDYDVLFTADGATTAFAKVTFHRSAAYYVLVSTDYDFSDPGPSAIQFMDWMHRDHPEMRITHFWAPYTYTDPAVTSSRRAELDTWIQAQHEMFGDEIGLHIHPYCNFVVDAGVTCLTTPSTIYPEGDASGYTVELAAYGRDDLGILLQHAADLFAQHGLGRPVVFRAGGWTVDLSSLLALVDNGYVVDGSAINWSRIEEWQGKDLYTWTMTHWASIGDTSQPYWPSRADILSSTPAPDLPLLEVPDNGVMIDYVTNDEMTSIFDANWDGNALAAPRTLVMGFHPAPQMSYDEYKRVQHLLGLADMHLATRDLGPVVYTTMKDVAPAFAMP